MVKLTPVDYDPFASGADNVLEEQPRAPRKPTVAQMDVRARPVQFDPFEGQGPWQEMEAAEPQYAPTFDSFADAFGTGSGVMDSLGNVIDHAQQVTGQGIASTLPTLGANVAGAIGGALFPPAAPVGLAGSVGISGSQVSGELNQVLTQVASDWNTQNPDIKPLTFSDIDPLTQSGSVASAALEAFAPFKMASRLAKGVTNEAQKKVARDLIDEIIKNRITKRAATGELAKRIGADTAKGAAEEGVTEAAQEGIILTAESGVTGETPLTQESLARIVESGAGGALAGGTMSGTISSVPESGAIAALGKRTARDTVETTKDFIDIARERQQQMAARRQQPEPSPEVETVQAIPEPAPVPQPEPVATAPEPEAEPVNPRRTKVVTPTTNQEIETEFEVVDVSELQPADQQGEFQPRERDRNSMIAQVDNIVREFDPERVVDSRVTSAGAPIVASDSNVIESGNGRTMAIARIYSENPEAAERYRQIMRERGFDVDGIERPILIRRRKTELTPEERQSFINDSNNDDKAALSVTEQARIDVSKLTPEDLMTAAAGSDLTTNANAGFVSRFMRKVSAGERNQMLTPDGKRFSQAGIKRMQAALMAAAYGDVDLVQRFFETPDSNVKSIGNAMLDVSGKWAATIARGVADGLDITPNIREALNLIARARQDGISIKDALAQTDIESGAVNPLTERLVRAFYNENLTRSRSSKAIRSVLDAYITEAGNIPPGDNMFGEPPPTADEVLTTALGKMDDSQEQSGMNFEESIQGVLSSMPGDLSATRTTPDAVRGLTPVEDQNRASEQTENYGLAESDNVQIYVDAGYDPDVAANFKPRRKLRIMKEQIEKKYGFKVAYVDDKLSLNNALSHLSDMYTNLHNMAFVLGLPTRAMGLFLESSKTGQNQLQIRLEKKNKRYLGVYNPVSRSIGLPQQANSFAHEWLHALDFLILEKAGMIDNKGGRKKGIASFVEGASSKIRAGEASLATNSLQGFADVMNAIFFDQDKQAVEIMMINREMQQAKTKEQKARLQAELDRIKSGSAPMVDAETQGTNFVKGAENLSRKANDDYWAKPEELLARAFESYIAHRLDKLGADTMGLSKTDKLYRAGSDQVIREKYPQLSDRLNIYRAFDRMFEAVSAEGLLSDAGVTPAQMQANPAKHGLKQIKYDKTAENYRNDQKAKTFMQRIAQQTKEEVDNIKAQIKREKSRPANPRSAGKTLQTAVSAVGSSDRTVMLTMIKRYPQATSLKNIAAALVKTPGSTRYNNLTDKDGRAMGTFEEEERILRSRWSNMLHTSRKKNGTIKLDEEQTRMLRDVMLGEKTDGVPQNIIKYASEMRRIFNVILRDLQNAGANIQMERDSSYLPRVYDTIEIKENTEGFLDKASEVYQIMADRVFQQVIDNFNADPMESISVIMDILNEIAGSTKNPEVKSNIKKLRALRRRLNNAVKEGDEVKVNALTLQMYDMASNFWPSFKREIGDVHASLWLTKIQGFGSRVDAFLNNPKPSFMKGRALPPEADIILADFMYNDPVQLMENYIEDAANETAWLRRKGILNDAISRIRAEGVQEADAQFVNRIIQNITGRDGANFWGSDGTQVSSTIKMFGVITVLAKSTLASLAEPLSVGIRTGRIRDGLRALAASYGLIGKKLLAGGGDPASEIEFITAMEAAGLMGSAFSEMALMNKLNSADHMRTNHQRIVQTSFRNTMQTTLTRIQHHASLKTADVYLRSQARLIVRLQSKLKQAKKNKASSVYINSLEYKLRRAKRQFGEVFPTDSELMAEWIVTDLGNKTLGIDMSMEAIDPNAKNPFLYNYLIAMGRIRDESIQVSYKEEKSSFAKTDIGSMMFAITSFTASFYENVPKRAYRRYMEIAKSDGHPTAMVEFMLKSFLPAYMTLILGNTLTQLVRTALFNPERFEEWSEEDDTFWDDLLMAGVSASGTLGPVFDKLANALFSNVRYNSDLSSVFSGPYVETRLQSLQKLLGLARNSPNTNTQEHNAIRGGYELFVAPAAAYGLNVVPLGGPLARVAGVTQMYVTSNRTSEKVADAIIGEKKGKTDANFQRARNEN